MEDFDEGVGNETVEICNDLSFDVKDLDENLTPEDLDQKSITDIRTLWPDAFKVPLMNNDCSIQDLEEYKNCQVTINFMEYDNLSKGSSSPNYKSPIMSVIEEES